MDGFDPAWEAKEDLEAEADPDLDDDGIMDVKEAFTAAWKAKAKVSPQTKQRGWKGTNVAKETSLQDKKSMSTCASCGGKGHWKGDRECPNVKSGKDPLHSATSSTSTTRRAPNGGVGTMTVHEVNYTPMVGSGGDVDERPTPSPKCPDCGHMPSRLTPSFAEDVARSEAGWSWEKRKAM